MDQETTPDEDAYFNLAETWDAELYGKLKRDRLIAIVVAAVASVLAALSIFAVSQLAPLKSVEPYMVLVDKTTGYAEAVQELKYNTGGSLTEDEVVVEAEIYNYVVARHTYDPTDYERRYNDLRFSTNANGLRSVTQEFARDNRTLSTQHRRTVNVKTIAPNLKKETARVRFSTTLVAPNGDETVQDWYVEMSYDFADLKIPNKERYRNPLGFIVKSYRLERETL